MKLAEVISELPRFTVAERQELIRSALVFDDAGLSPQEAAIVESRLSAHRADPASAVSLEEMKSRLSARVDA
jgi:hypothetical protein